MSISKSISVDSSSSTVTMATIPSTDLQADSSNDLYENRDHFESIFSNDSRFFDTSLHLFKSYCILGYIQSDNEKLKKQIIPPLMSTSNGHKHRWRPRLLGLNHNHENRTETIKAFLTPTLLKKTNPSTSIRSGSDVTTNETNDRQQKTSMVAQYQRQTVPTIIIPDDDESEITITRL